MTKQQDFSMWSVNFILFCLANFLYYGAFYLYIPVLTCSSVILLSLRESKQAPDERRALKAACSAY